MLSDSSGNLLQGYGYVISPTFLTYDTFGRPWYHVQNGINYTRLPLEESNGTVSRVKQFEITDEDGGMIDFTLTGLYPVALAF